jgi:hypothetical protein
MYVTFPSLMTIALMDCPDVRIKPPNYHTQLIGSSATILNPGNQNFLFPIFSSLHRRFLGTRREQNLHKTKMARIYTNTYNSLGYFCIPVR